MEKAMSPFSRTLQTYQENIKLHKTRKFYWIYVQNTPHSVSAPPLSSSNVSYHHTAADARTRYPTKHILNTAATQSTQWQACYLIMSLLKILHGLLYFTES